MNPPRPSLNALRAFEATARLRSMSAAATELFVTHGAVSRHIRTLEETLGLPLLKRGRSMEPTPEGARLAEGLSTAFNLIEASVEQVLPGPLTVSCSSTVMMYWLIPRIAGFHAAHPQIEVQFNMNYDQIEFIRDKVSIAIRNSTIVPPRDVVIQDLTTEWIGPICSPDYLRDASIQDLTNLNKAKLLNTKTRPGAWEDWAKIVGLTEAPKVQESYEHFYLLIQAALCDLGIAVVPFMLVLDLLRSGRLMAPFGFVPGPRKLVLWIAPHLASRADTRAMSKWLTEEFKKTAEVCSGNKIQRSIGVKSRSRAKAGAARSARR